MDEFHLLGKKLKTNNSVMIVDKKWCNSKIRMMNIQTSFYHSVSDIILKIQRNPVPVSKSLEEFGFPLRPACTRNHILHAGPSSISFEM